MPIDYPAQFTEKPETRAGRFGSVFTRDNTILPSVLFADETLSDGIETSPSLYSGAESSAANAWSHLVSSVLS